MTRTRSQEERATMRLCVFCDKTHRLDEHVCVSCQDYKGMALARKCPTCNRTTFVEDDDCPYCGADMEE